MMARPHALGLLAIFWLLSATWATAQHGVYFDYHRPDPDHPVHLNHPHVDGVLLRFSWAALERVKGQYDFSDLERNIVPWAKAGKRVLVGISLAGQQPGVTPEWLFRAVPAVDFVRSGKGSHVRVPQYWDPRFLPEVSGLVRAFGQRYAHDARVEAVMIGVGHIGFLTAAPNGAGAHAFLAAGWTPEVWKQYTWTLCDLYRTALGDKPLFLRGSNLVLREANPARVGFPHSRPNFTDVRDDILWEAANRYHIGVGCNGLEGDPAKFIANGIPALYHRLDGGAAEGKYCLELSDDWPMWVNAARRATSAVDAKADNAYFQKCLENAVGGVNGLPRLHLSWIKMLETDLDCTDPANRDYQPECEKKLIWFKQQLMAAAPSVKEPSW